MYATAEERKDRARECPGAGTRVPGKQTLEENGQARGREKVSLTPTSNTLPHNLYLDHDTKI